MKLTVDDLMSAILSARRLEQLQCDLRQAMIDRLVDQSTPSQAPANTERSGATAA